MTAKPLPCDLKSGDRAGGCDPALIVETLSDDAARAMFLEFEEPTTAAEVAAERDVPSSTAYRKIEKLERAGLIVPASESETGATRYVKAMDCISLTYDRPMRITCVRGGLELSCEVEDGG